MTASSFAAGWTAAASGASPPSVTMIVWTAVGLILFYAITGVISRELLKRGWIEEGEAS